jgi:hypothetical protein
MKNTVALLVLSILEFEDLNYAESKISTIRAQLQLNEVEQLIIADLENSIQLGELTSRSFIEHKYPYYFDEDLLLDNDLFSRDSLDSAITELRGSQLKSDLAEGLIDLGGKVTKLNPKEIKERLAELHSSALIESKFSVSKNRIQKRKDAYGDISQHNDGLSLVLPAIEQHAGKALKGTVVSILANVGEYKSTYSLNVGYTNALLGYNILYLALESTAEKLETKMILNHIACTEKDPKKLINGHLVRDKVLTKEQQKTYNAAQNDMIDQLDNHFIMWDTSDIYYDTLVDMTTELRKADKLFQDTTGKGLDGVVIDQVSLLKYTKGSGKKGQYDGGIINDWVSYFREQALNFLEDDRQIVVFMVGQVKREAYAEVSKKSKYGRYDASCPSDSHEIERSSATMITLFTDKNTRNTVLINIPKAREGEIPEHPLTIEVYGEYSHLGPLATDSQGSGNITLEDFNTDELSIEDVMDFDS